MPELDRRDFLKLVGAGAGAAAASGCSDPVEKLIPYVVQPEEIVPGIAVTYATTCRECPAGCGVHARTREGRPVFLEGNPDHPINRGALCARGTASIGRTYHPDRYRQPLARGSDGRLEPIGWEEATALLAAKLRAAGSAARILGGATGPTLSGLIDRFVEAAGLGPRVVYEPFAYEALREASRLAFGVDGQPVFDLSGADLVVDFGSDFLDAWLSPMEHARQLAGARDVGQHPDGGARLVYVGPRLSLTAGNADRWIPARPGVEGVLALGVARAAFDAARAGGRAIGNAALLERLLADFDPAAVASKSGVSEREIRELAASLLAARRPAVLPPGVAVTGRRATAATAAVFVLAAVVGAVGTTILARPDGEEAGRPARFADVLDLVKEMREGAVRVLLIHDSNPVHSLASAGFAAALGRVGFTVSFASVPDETSERADLILPDHSPLESWGDARPRVGVRGLIQPALRPLFDTQALGDALLQTARALGEQVAGKLPSGSFRGVLEAAWSGADWRAALARGGVYATPPAAPELGLQPELAKLDFSEPTLEGSGPFVLLAFPSPTLYDGRGAHLPWLQELPDPVTKLTWQSWAEVSPKTASGLGVKRGDVLALETPAGRIEVPALPRGGIRDDVIAVAIGQGHTVGRYASRAGAARGANVIAALPATSDDRGGRVWLSVRAEARRTGSFERPAIAQDSDNQRGRQLAESVSLAALASGHGEGHGGGHGAAPAAGHDQGSHEIRAPYDPADFSLGESPYRWSMLIDLDRCTGCSACVAACSLENNVPNVGEEMVARSRQMHWLRIERYVGAGEPEFGTGRGRPESSERLGDTDVRHMPQLCQHCGAAPCEPVCPVFATYHNAEGLNGMVYNRCIGTRYCSNNCPYKVRRFNWFDYSIEAWPDPLPLMLNPDVTVRGQGVMEKCTFCIQRIELGRQAAKDAGRPIGDGEVETACQRACPTDAIAFGNAKDRDSEVVKRARAHESRAYHALHVLNTRPGITYLAKVRRGEEGADR